MEGPDRSAPGDVPLPGEMRTEPLQVSVYAGRYAVDSEIGRGAMGRVLRARDAKIGREVALKILAPGARRERFEQEARAAGALNHPNIIAVYDVGEHDGEPFIVSELLQGRTLRAALRDGPLPAAEVLDFAVQLADGLAAAHKAGIVHRDLKPENLFVTDGGRLKILDFGIAKLQKSGEAFRTEAGTVLGTPAYMSPEQVRGDPADAPSDVFACGCVISEMLSGKPPFLRDDNMATACAIAHEPATPAPAGPLAPVITRCLEKNPAARYPDAGQLLDDLRAIARGQSVAAGRRSRRRAAILTLAGIVTVAGITAAVWHALPRGQPPSADVIAAAAKDGAPSIAVLPFADLSPAKDQEYFSDGIAEEILNALTQIDGLRVAGRTSAFSFKGKNEELASIARKLHVATLLEGSVRKSGNRVRITAQLISAKDGFHLWSKQYDRELTDIFKIQGELAMAVVEALKVKLLPGAPVPFRLQPAKDPEAYRLVLLGRSLLLQQTEASQPRAVEMLEKAVALEPTYAPGWFNLSLVRENLSLDAPRTETLQRARSALDAVEHALAAAPDLPGAYVSRAWVKSQLFWDWEGARADLDRAAALGPFDNAVFHGRAIFQEKMGRLKEAIRAERTYLEQDPLNSIGWTNLGSFLGEDGQLQAAREAYAHSLEISPENASAARGLAEVELLEGQPAKALALVAKMPQQVDRLVFTAIAQHDEKALGTLRAMVDGPEGDVAYGVATVYGWWGDRDAAFEWLDRAYDRHDLRMRWVKCDAMLRNIRGDRRYPALLKKMNLPLD